MKTAVASVILSGLVAYGVSTKVARKAHIEQEQAVQEQIDNAVEEMKGTDKYRAEQFADLNVECHFALQNLDDMNHMIITQSNEARENRKDIDQIIMILQSMRRPKK